MAPFPIVGTYAPLNIDETLTLPRFMVEFNPDNVPDDKLVHVDTISGKSLTYGGLRELAGRCGWGLRHKLPIGLKEGQRLLAIVPNSTDFVLLAHSTWWAGACFSPLNMSSTTKEIAHALTLVQPSYVAVETSRLEELRAAMLSVGMDIPIMTLLSKADNLPLFPDNVIGHTQNERLPPFDLARTGKSSKTTPAAICFSSGTTGRFKGVLLSHYNLIINILQSRVSVPTMVNSDAREVFFPPYCHIYGMSVVVTMGMWLGSFTCALPGFDLEIFCQKMSQYSANWAHIVPPVAVLLAQSDVPVKYDLSALKRIIVAAAPMKKPLQMRLKARFGESTKVLQGYGLTECSPGVMLQHDSDEADYVGTVGKVIAGTEVRLVDPVTTHDIDPYSGKEGELWVRGPQVMTGYLGDTQATRDTFSPDGQWLRTGDIMRMDKNNNFWITDRLKELIKYKGFQVAPSELEDLLLHHPHVVDAAVCSIYDDDQATELPLAYVSLKPDLVDLAQEPKQKILRDIRTWVDGQVAGYKKLRGGVFHLQQLPKTPTGKILRKDLPAKVQQARKAKI